VFETSINQQWWQKLTPTLSSHCRCIHKDVMHPTSTFTVLWYALYIYIYIVSLSLYLSLSPHRHLYSHPIAIATYIYIFKKKYTYTHMCVCVYLYNWANMFFLSNHGHHGNRSKVSCSHIPHGSEGLRSCRSPSQRLTGRFHQPMCGFPMGLLNKTIIFV
jgi:hypothetical protein